MVIQSSTYLHSWRFLLSKAPPFVFSLLTAEIFFRFGSFTAECLTFLALWYGLDLVYERVRSGETATR
jgi:hypothetical protein